MEWNEQTTNRFDELRLKQIAGDLTIQEQEELSAIIQSLESEESELLSDYFAQIVAENKTLQSQLETIQQENEALAQLSIQQEQLAADARRWLVEFDQRNLQIQKDYSRLTNDISQA